MQLWLSHTTQTKRYSVKRWNLKLRNGNICLHNEEELHHATLCQKAALVLAGLKTNKKNHMDGESIQSDSAQV